MCFCFGMNLSEVIEVSAAWSVDRSRWSWTKKKALEERTVPSWLSIRRSLTLRRRRLQAVVITVTVVIRETEQAVLEKALQTEKCDLTFPPFGLIFVVLFYEM